LASPEDILHAAGVAFQELHYPTAYAYKTYLDDSDKHDGEPQSFYLPAHTTHEYDEPGTEGWLSCGNNALNFSIALTSQPLHNVTIKFRVGRNTYRGGARPEGMINGLQYVTRATYIDWLPLQHEDSIEDSQLALYKILTWEPGHWNNTKNVSVCGLNDYFDDGNTTWQLYSTLFSSDLLYETSESGANFTVLFVNEDDDKSDVEFLPGAKYVTEKVVNKEIVITYRLMARPLYTVLLQFDSSNNNYAVCIPEVATVTTSNWWQEKTVVVSAVDNFVDNKNRSFAISCGVMYSIDEVYNVLQTIQSLDFVAEDDPHDNSSYADAGLFVQLNPDSPATKTSEDGAYVVLEVNLTSIPVVSLLDSMSLPITCTDHRSR
jgi:hypothetical protein